MQGNDADPSRVGIGDGYYRNRDTYEEDRAR